LDGFLHDVNNLRDLHLFPAVKYGFLKRTMVFYEEPWFSREKQIFFMENEDGRNKS